MKKVLCVFNRKSATRRWFEKHEYLKNKQAFNELRNSVPEIDWMARKCETMPIKRANTQFIKDLRASLANVVGWNYKEGGFRSTTDAWDTVWFELIAILLQRGADI